MNYTLFTAKCYASLLFHLGSPYLNLLNFFIMNQIDFYTFQIYVETTWQHQVHGTNVSSFMANIRRANYASILDTNWPNSKNFYSKNIIRESSTGNVLITSLPLRSRLVESQGYLHIDDFKVLVQRETSFSLCKKCSSEEKIKAHEHWLWRAG